MPDNSIANTRLSRRHLILGAAALSLKPGAALAAMAPPAGPPRPLVDRAMAFLASAAGKGLGRDMVGLVDFSAPSRSPRFHLLDPVSGRVRTLLVAHGRGSDPDHSGWVRRFSNQPGSNASSAGAYRMGDIYMGKHGRSRRLIGLESENSNAEARAIVLHSAWYVSGQMARDTGKIGRSEGCFAVSPDDLDLVLDRLAPGRLLFASKV